MFSSEVMTMTNLLNKHTEYQLRILTEVQQVILKSVLVVLGHQIKTILSSLTNTKMTHLKKFLNGSHTKIMIKSKPFSNCTAKHSNYKINVVFVNHQNSSGKSRDAKSQTMSWISNFKH